MEKGFLLIRAELSIQRMLEEWRTEGERELLSDHEAWLGGTYDAKSVMLTHVGSILAAKYVGLSKRAVLSYRKDSFPIKWVRHLENTFSWRERSKFIDLKKVESTFSRSLRILGFLVKGVVHAEKLWSHRTIVYYLNPNDYGYPYSPVAGHSIYPSEYVPWAAVRYHLKKAVEAGRVFPDRFSSSYGMPYESRPDSFDNLAYALYEKGGSASIKEIPDMKNDDIQVLQDEGIIKRNNDTIRLNGTWLEGVIRNNPSERYQKEETSVRRPRGRRGLEKLEDELSYIRATPASKRVIQKKHVELANKFRAWIEKNGAENIIFEQDYVDIRFTANELDTIAELKIAGNSTPLQAIREAIGQLLQYNYHGDSGLADRWLIVLDAEPSPSDIEFVNRLREGLNIPLFLLSLGENGGFVIHGI